MELTWRTQLVVVIAQALGHNAFYRRWRGFACLRHLIFSQIGHLAIMVPHHWKISSWTFNYGATLFYMLVILRQLSSICKNLRNSICFGLQCQTCSKWINQIHDLIFHYTTWCLEPLRGVQKFKKSVLTSYLTPERDILEYSLGHICSLFTVSLLW